ncbi:TPA: hypothetical protein EYP83_01750 [Candidatus Geothermarchaeota archaeon]|nr:hypothetical protein [Candidatus Geothermarchaeota archaeon]HIQ13179.1 hypothetical protein [Thermoprotei archaeon]
MKLESKDFRYGIKIFVDNKRGKIYSYTLREFLEKLNLKIYSYGVDIKKMSKTNVIQALTLESIKSLNHEILFLHIKHDSNKIRKLLKCGYIEVNGQLVKRSKGTIFLILEGSDDSDFIVLRGEILKNKIIL